jgi:hypothetical protein
MEIRLLSEAAPGRPMNEDHAFVYGDLVGVLDGVTEDPTIDSGCRHGPAWYVRRLAAHIGRAQAVAPEATLAQLLARAIDAVRGDHGGDCDLECPSTPASTVCMVRANTESLEYLVLGDSPLVLDCGEVNVIGDERFARTIARIREAALAPQGTLNKYRYTNRPGGYWIAATDPQAALEAIAGTVPLGGPSRVRRAALLTDGASRAVEQFGLMDWVALLDVLTVQGPAELIRQVREAERADHHERPGHKRHDDATAAICFFDQG